MKVTKAIRVYIEDQVHTKATNSERIAQLKEKADKSIEEFNKSVERLQDEVAKLVKEVAAQYSIEIPRGYKAGFSLLNEWYLPDVRAYKSALSELQEKEKHATTEIIATMELGATKAELMEMINNLKF